MNPNLIIIIIIIIICPPAQSMGVKTKQSVKHDYNGFSFGVHYVEEGDRIPPLQSYGQTLKQKPGFSDVLGDDCGASANLLD